MKQPVISKRAAVLIVPCALAIGLQADYNYINNRWGNQFVELLINYNVDIIPLPCSEASFNGYKIGLSRKKHGIGFYSEQDGYVEYCGLLAKQTLEMILDMITTGYGILAILGVEHSPSCAVSYIYTNKGTVSQAGLFFDALMQNLNNYNLEIATIGINRKYPRKALERLERIIMEKTGFKKD